MELSEQEQFATVQEIIMSMPLTELDAKQISQISGGLLTEEQAQDILNRYGELKQKYADKYIDCPNCGGLCDRSCDNCDLCETV